MKAAVIVSAVLGSAAVAAEFTVSNLDNSGVGSLRQAIADSNAAPGHDTIRFAPGLAAAGARKQIAVHAPYMLVADSLQIVGPGSSALRLVGRETEDSRIFQISAAAPAQVEISGLTIESAFYEEDGGGVWSDADVVFRDCHFFDNESLGSGGGLFIAGGSVELIDCVLEGNRSGGDGGGLHVADGATASLRGGAVEDNLTYNRSENGNGGGIWCGGTITCAGTRFAENQAEDRGGGIYLAASGEADLEACVFQWNIRSALETNGGTVALRRCEFLNNGTRRSGTPGGTTVEGALRMIGATLTAERCVFDKNTNYWGGAVEVYSSDVELRHCLFRQNSARQSGGAVFLSGPGDHLLEGCSFTGNWITATAFSGSPQGAALSCRNGDARVVSCLFALSYTNGVGGAVFASNGTCYLTNCSLVSNRAQRGAALCISEGGFAVLRNCIVAGNESSFSDATLFYPLGGAADIDHSWIQDAAAAGAVGDSGSWGANNLDATVAGALLVAIPPSLEYSDRPAEPQIIGAYLGDYYLAKGSAGIAAGDPAADLDGAGAGVETIADRPFDLAGAPRAFDSIVDLGAFAWLVDADGDGVPDDVELLASGGGSRTSTAPGADGDSDGVGVLEEVVTGGHPRRFDQPTLKIEPAGGSAAILSFPLDTRSACRTEIEMQRLVAPGGWTEVGSAAWVESLPSSRQALSRSAPPTAPLLWMTLHLADGGSDAALFRLSLRRP